MTISHDADVAINACAIIMNNQKIISTFKKAKRSGAFHRHKQLKQEGGSIKKQTKNEVMFLNHQHMMLRQTQITSFVAASGTYLRENYFITVAAGAFKKY